MELENAVDLLPVEYRTVFIMRAVENLSTKEVSEYLGISESSVKIRLKRAKQKLKNYLMSEKEYSSVYIFLRGRCDKIVISVMTSITNIKIIKANKSAAFITFDIPSNIFSLRFW